jgi:hypothetical protein
VVQDRKKGLPVWVWIAIAVPAATFLLGLLSALGMYWVRKHIPRVEPAEVGGPAIPPPTALPSDGFLLPALPPMGPLAPLRGEPADLSSVMGRARKLANEWQADAALLGIDASAIVAGQIQTRDSGVATLTFGPSSFNVSQPRSGVFVVTYDHAGIRGVPAKGAPARALPEPMCAPEFIYRRVAGSESPSVSLRYAFDQNQRPVWLAKLEHAAKAKPLPFDAQNCQAAAPARR